MTEAVRDALREELESSRSEFHALLDTVGEPGWNVPSLNPGWTNGQLLFHMALGFFLLIPLLTLMWIFASLPRGWSRAFASLLNLSTPLFNWINGLGPRGGARFLNWRRLGPTFDSVHAVILRRIDSMRPGDWRRGMHYPRKWDPARFSDFMTFEDLFHYPTLHFRHHRAQITTKA